MARYVAISESEMSDFMEAIGFTELSVEQRGSFGRRPVKERVYETPVGAGRIRVYSSVVGPATRDRGKDAIRVQYWVGDQKVYGAKRVHRTQNWRKNLLQRTEEIRESAESGPLSRIPKDSRGDLMTARRGRLAHERFWGSVNYPEIRESRRFEAASVLPKGLKTDKITDRVMAIQYMMDDSEKQQKLLKLQTALKMGLITEDEILESLERAMAGKAAESNVARKAQKEELILEHLNNNRQTSKYDGKLENTEGGIVELLGITRSGVSKTLRDMEAKGLIYSRNLHVPGGRRKVQCWYVVGSGTDRGFGAEAESFKPPASAIAAAKKGLAQRKKWGRGGLSPAEAKSQGIDSGVTRARKIASGKVSKHDVRRMSAFNRHRKNNRPDKKMPDGGPTAGTIAWNLWGGTSGVNWAKKKSAAMNAEDYEIIDGEVMCRQCRAGNYESCLYGETVDTGGFWLSNCVPDLSRDAETFEAENGFIFSDDYINYGMGKMYEEDKNEVRKMFLETIKNYLSISGYPHISDDKITMSLEMFDSGKWRGEAFIDAPISEMNAEELSKTSCCCGADESNPCACMKAPEPMSCRAKEPKCACYKALEKNAETFEAEHRILSYVDYEHNDDPYTAITILLTDDSATIENANEIIDNLVDEHGYDPYTDEGDKDLTIYFKDIRGKTLRTLNYNVKGNKANDAIFEWFSDYDYPIGGYTAETFAAVGYDVASWNPADEPTEEEAVWEQFYQNLSSDDELVAKLWDLEGQPSKLVENWWNNIEGTDEHEKVFERHYELINKVAHQNWDDALEEMAQQWELEKEAREKYEKRMEDLMDDPDYTTLSSESSEDYGVEPRWM